MLSADAFAAFEEAEAETLCTAQQQRLSPADVRVLQDRAVSTLGRRFRDTVLALGGGRAPAGVFSDFRLRAPSVRALLRHNGLAGHAS